MTDIVARARDVLKGVTDGPWFPGGDGPTLMVAGPGLVVAHVADLADVHFIAQARSLVPELVAEVERLRALVPAGSGDPRDPTFTDTLCRRCQTQTQWGWCPVCQPAEYERLP